MEFFHMLTGLPPGFSYLFLFSVGLCLLSIGEELVAPGRRDWVLMGIFAALAVILWHANLVHTRAIREFSYLFQAHVPAIFVLGPLMRRLLHERIQGGKRPRLWPHLLPALAVFLLMLPHFLADEAVRISRLENFYKGARPHFTTMLFIGGVVHGLGYIAWSIRPVLLLLSAERVRREGVFRAALFLVVLGAVACVGIIISLMGGTHGGLNIFVPLVAALVPGLHLIRRRYPRFFEHLEEAVETERYRRSQLGGIDLDAVRRRMDDLMEKERLYTDEDLNLAVLAERLEITRHQLSELLNDRLGINFTGYVNGHRIRRARELLRAEPDRTILSIAYEVGFNSKTTFNTVFSRETGMSPSRWRRKPD